MADLWYRLVDGQSEGPHTFSDLQRMAASGEITPQDRLCEDGQNWIPAEQVAGLTFGAGRGSAGAALQPLPYLSSGGPTNAVVTARVVELLRDTSRWTRIVAILMFVGSGLMILGGFCMFGNLFIGRGGPAANPEAFIGCAYVPLAILYIVPAIFLYRYAKHSKSFAVNGDERDFENAIAAQKSFWKFVAMTALVMVALYVVALIVFIAVVGFAVIAHR